MYADSVIGPLLNVLKLQMCGVKREKAVLCRWFLIRCNLYDVVHLFSSYSLKIERRKTNSKLKDLYWLLDFC